MSEQTTHEIQPGDRVLVRNAAGGYLSHDVLGRRVETEYVVRETSPTLGVRLTDGWYALACVERVGGPRPVHPEPDPYLDNLIAQRAALAVALRDVVLNAWKEASA